MCFDWFTIASGQNIPISGPKVKAKASEIAEQLGLSDFSASNGWLQKWKIRNNIAFKCVTDEGSGVSQSWMSRSLRPS